MNPKIDYHFGSNKEEDMDREEIYWLWFNRKFYETSYFCIFSIIKQHQFNLEGISS